MVEIGPREDIQLPWGYSWRSSPAFIITCIITALFAENFLYGFVVPILPYILEIRNHVDPTDTQRLTYQILTLYGATAVAAGIVIGQLADSSKSRKLPLVLGLAFALLGTTVFATSTKLPGLFVGRILQAIGSTTAWIVGYATLRDTISGEDMGKTFGLVNSFVCTGALTGPAVAGFLLQLTGYWPTWSVVLVILVLDITMRLVMIENPKKNNVNSTDNSNPVSTEFSANTEACEECALLAGSSAAPGYNPTTDGADTAQTGDISVTSFYRIILSRPRVLVGLASYMLHSSILASYSTTIPTHVRNVFGWGSLPTGMLFMGLQIPSIVLSPISGWARDKVGTRLPTGMGFILLAPLLWLLGAAHWLGSKDTAKTVYVTVIISIGCVSNLLTSVGTIEITSVVDELQSKHPGIFGSQGGYSRCYSLSNVSFTTGFLVGPLLSGALADAVGYYWMNLVLSCICIVMSILSFSFLKGKLSVQQTSPEDESMNPRV